MPLQKAFQIKTIYLYLLPRLNFIELSKCYHVLNGDHKTYVTKGANVRNESFGLIETELPSVVNSLSLSLSLVH